MKTYELEILNNTGADVKGLELNEILTNKAWQVFNEGESENTIHFQQNGVVINSVNGITSIGEWNLIDDRNVIHIVYDNQKQGFLFRFVFKVDEILVFQLDYTNKYAFLIDRQFDALKQSNTLSSLLRLLLPSVYLNIVKLNIEIDINYSNDEHISKIYLPYGIKKIPNCCFKGCSYLKEILIPDTVEEIGEEAFMNCTCLNELFIPKGVKILKRSVFEGCCKIKQINLPDSIYIIDDSAFKDCRRLECINIPNEVTEINNEAFRDCVNIRSMQLPNGITNISEKLFYNCYNLDKIEIPETVTTIGDCSFAYCENLRSIFIPKNVDQIRSTAFAYCNKLSSIVVANDNPVYDSRENCNAIIETKSNSLKHGFVSTRIPNGITKIKSYAYYYIGVKHVSLPSSVIEVEKHSFFSCSYLESVLVPNTTKTISEEFYAKCNSLKTIMIGIVELIDTITLKEKIKNITECVKNENIKILQVCKSDLIMPSKFVTIGRGNGVHSFIVTPDSIINWVLVENNERSGYTPCFEGLIFMKLCSWGINNIEIIDIDGYLGFNILGKVYCKIRIELVDEKDDKGNMYTYKRYVVLNS